LNQGKIENIGQTKEVVSSYEILHPNSSKVDLTDNNRKGEGKITLKAVSVKSNSGSIKIKSGEKIRIMIEYDSIYSQAIDDIKLSIVLYSKTSSPLVRFDSSLTKNTIKKIAPRGMIICETDALNLGQNLYYLNLAIWQNNILQDFIFSAYTIEILQDNKKYSFSDDHDIRTDNILIAHSFFNSNN
jgi:hypothetical protein